MDYSWIQILLVFIVTFVAAIDQFDFLESLYQPIVMGPVIGLILGDLQTGLIVGGTYQLMTIGNMPVGGGSAAECGYRRYHGDDSRDHAAPRTDGCRRGCDSVRAARPVHGHTFVHTDVTRYVGGGRLRA